MHNSTIKAQGFAQKWLIPSWQFKAMARSALIIFVCWLPWAIAIYPGSMNWDTFYQITMWYPGAPRWFIPWAETGTLIPNAFSDHHPIFDTFIYGLFAKSSDWLFGSWNFGIFTFLIIQAYGLSFSLSASLAFLRRIKVPETLLVALFFFIALYPPFAIYAFTMVKDTLFALIFLPWIICLASIVLKVEILPKQNNTLLLFAVLSLLLCLTKKPGLLIVAFALLVLWVQNKPLRSKVAGILGACIVTASVFIPLVVFPIFDIAPGGKQEALAPLFQQTAYFVNNYEEEITAEEREAIDAVLGMDRLKEVFDPRSADIVKNGWHWQSTNAEILDYLKVWAAQGLRHPDAYFKALWGINAGYFTWEGIVSPDVYLADASNTGWDLLHYPPGLEGYRTAMLGLYQWLAATPIIGWLFHIELFTLFVPLVLFVTALSKEKSLLPICAAVALSMVVLFVGPVYQTRYGIHLIFAAPFLAALAGRDWMKNDQSAFCKANEG